MDDIDIGSVLNDSARDTVEISGGNDRNSDNLLSEDAASDLLSSAADDIFDNLSNSEVPKKAPRPKGKYSILKSAATEVLREEGEQTELLVNAAVSTIAHDQRVQQEVANMDKFFTSTNTVENILAQTELDESPGVIDKILEEAAENSYEDEFFVELDKLGDDHEDNKGDEDDKSKEEDDSDSDDDDDAIPSNPEGEMELRHLCHSGEVSRIEKVLAKGQVNIYAPDQHGWTCLHWAVSQNNDEIIELLLSHSQKKSFVNSPDLLCGWTPLHVACIRGHKDAIKVLLKHKAKVGKTNKLGETPLDCLTLPRQSAEGRSIRKLLTAAMNNPIKR